MRAHRLLAVVLALVVVGCSSTTTPSVTPPVATAAAPSPSSAPWTYTTQGSGSVTVPLFSTPSALHITGTSPGPNVSARAVVDVHGRHVEAIVSDSAVISFVVETNGGDVIRFSSAPAVGAFGSVVWWFGQVPY